MPSPVAQSCEKFKDIICQGPTENLNQPRDGSENGSEADCEEDEGTVMALVPPDDPNVPLFAVVLMLSVIKSIN